MLASSKLTTSLFGTRSVDLRNIFPNSPFGFAGADKASLMYMREAEVKHSRLAMLAVVGWPLAELFDKPLAEATNLPTLLTKTGASPSILNGGLDQIDALYWVAVVLMAGIIEIESSKVQAAKGKDYIPGDCGFDPLGFYPKTKEAQKEMQTKEIKHGRLAMMAIVGFAIQEALYRTPVVAETPQFFKPLF
jgi:Chlorophyll A-B binding protein